MGVIGKSCQLGEFGRELAPLRGPGETGSNWTATSPLTMERANGPRGNASVTKESDGCSTVQLVPCTDLIWYSSHGASCSHPRISM